MRFKENLISFEDQWSILKSFHLLLAIWMALGIGQSLLFPLFQLQDVKPGLFRLNHFPFHKFEAVPTCCPEGVLFPPRNLLIIRDICMFHAQLHQKNSTSLPSKAFYFSFQVAIGIVRVITSMMVRFTAIAENNNNNNNNNNRKIKPFGHRRAPKNEQNATFWSLGDNGATNHHHYHRHCNQLQTALARVLDELEGNQKKGKSS